jgi:hypothetical protein
LALARFNEKRGGVSSSQAQNFLDEASAGLSYPAMNSSPAARLVKFDRKKKGLTGN